MKSTQCSPGTIIKPWYLLFLFFFLAGLVYFHPGRFSHIVHDFISHNCSVLAIFKCESPSGLWERTNLPSTWLIRSPRLFTFHTEILHWWGLSHLLIQFKIMDLCESHYLNSTLFQIWTHSSKYKHSAQRVSLTDCCLNVCLVTS